MMCPNCRYTGTHHPACNHSHVVGAPAHHHHGHRRGAGWWGPGWDYPVYVTCPVGWVTDANGMCQPPMQIVGQDAQPAGFNPLDPFGSGYDYGINQQRNELNARILLADSRVQAALGRLPADLRNNYLAFRAYWQVVNTDKITKEQLQNQLTQFNNLMVQMKPYGQFDDLAPQPGFLDRFTKAGDGLGKGISDAALYIGLAGLAIVGVIAYTAYKTDAPRHAADFARSQAGRAESSAALAAKLAA